MNRFKIKAIIDSIDGLAKMGIVSSDEQTALKKAVSDLHHAISIKDYSEIEKAVGKIAKLLLRKM